MALQYGGVEPILHKILKTVNLPSFVTTDSPSQNHATRSLCCLKNRNCCRDFCFCRGGFLTFASSHRLYFAPQHRSPNTRHSHIVLPPSSVYCFASALPFSPFFRSPPSTIQPTLRLLFLFFPLCLLIYCPSPTILHSFPPLPFSSVSSPLLVSSSRLVFSSLLVLSFSTRLHSLLRLLLSTHCSSFIFPNFPTFSNPPLPFSHIFLHLFLIPFSLFSPRPTALLQPPKLTHLPSPSSTAPFCPSSCSLPYFSLPSILLLVPSHPSPLPSAAFRSVLVAGTKWAPVAARLVTNIVVRRIFIHN